MFGTFILRLSRRGAISTIIGGVIVLSLLLTALATVVFVSQQYDQYQQTANKMTQLRSNLFSENLVINAPGLIVVNSTTGTISGWGSGCGISTANPEYNCYDITISNLGTVGVLVTRIYINSTGLPGSGCSHSTSSTNPQPCIINPTPSIAPYGFNPANEFLNPGETNHTFVFALPTGVALPDPNPAYPQNAIIIATSRGNAFTFQWPFQASVFGQSQSAFSSGNMRVAYTGAKDSANEPLGGTPTGNGFCHTENLQSYPAGPGYAEKLTGLGTYGDSGVLYFVNPWLTNYILESGATFYLYVIIVNTGLTSYTPSAGSLDLTWYGSNHIDGSLIGDYYNGAFYAAASAPSIPPGAFYYAIFESTEVTTTGMNGITYSVMWWGGASVTNGSGSNAEGNGYYSGTILVSGLWIRYEANSGSCA